MLKIVTLSILVVSTNTFAFNFSTCKTSVSKKEIEEQIISKSAEIDNRTKDRSNLYENFKYNQSRLRIEFSREPDEYLSTLGGRKCEEIKNELEKNKDVIIDTFKCRVNIVENPIGERVDRYPYGIMGPFAHTVELPLYTFKVDYSYKQIRPALTDLGIIDLKLKKVSECLSSESNSDRIKELLIEKKELQKQRDDISQTQSEE